MNDMMVSICCITYNHEKYIAEALDSFIAQKTDFKYEILVYDDASTDKTVEIIKAYEEKYPDLIKPIYQSINQYSLGVRVYTFNFLRARGKYTAMCEGDDYWTDVKKLQIQVDYMEKNPQCSLCVHTANKVTANHRIKGQVRPSRQDRSFTVEECILGGGSMFATDSMFFPTRLTQNLPVFFMESPVGDFPLAIYLALCGEVYYMDRCMSVYRISVRDSWKDKIRRSARIKLEHNDAMRKMMDQVNAYTDYKYSTTIEVYLLKKEIQLLVLIMDKEVFKSNRYRNVRNSLTLKQRCKVFVKVYMPFVVSFKRRMEDVFSEM